MVIYGTVVCSQGCHNSEDIGLLSEALHVVVVLLPRMGIAHCCANNCFIVQR